METRKIDNRKNQAVTSSAKKLFEQGAKYEEEENFKKAVECYQKSADQGNEDAQNNLGYLYYEGKGVSQDYEKAFALFKLAAEQNQKEAEYNLGLCYSSGNGIESSVCDAIKYFQDSEQHGFADARTELNKLNVDFNNFEPMIKNAKQYLEKHRGFLYDEYILKSFYLGLQTEQLILLMGRPGSGKSSLVREFAKVFGIEYHSIAVQANWTDRSDLLGYYNSIEQSYISTPFLDCLLKFCSEAKKEENQERLYFICLDEMNLSHIEYYFADFLSSLQDSDERNIELYSKRLYDSILEELDMILFSEAFLIKDLQESETDFTSNEVAQKLQERFTKSERLLKNLINNHEIDIFKRKYYVALTKKLQMVREFPYKIHIPENVKFIGTLNQDETTRNISPKVIDRSFVICFDGASKFAPQKAEEKRFELKQLIKYKRVVSYQVQDEESEVPSQDSFSVDIFNENEVLQDGIRYSQRVYKQTFGRSYTDAENKFSNEYERWCKVMHRDIVDDILIAATILPRIRSINRHDITNLVNSLREVLKIEEAKYKKTTEIFNKITKDTTFGIDFWKS